MFHPDQNSLMSRGKRTFLDYDNDLDRWTINDGDGFLTTWIAFTSPSLPPVNPWPCLILKKDRNGNDECEHIVILDLLFPAPEDGEDIADIKDGITAFETEIARRYEVLPSIPSLLDGWTFVLEPPGPNSANNSEKGADNG
jgi:hypothetical protein